MTFVFADWAVPHLEPGEHAYFVTEHPGVVVAGHGHSWTAGWISPKRTGFAGPFGFGPTRSAAVRALLR